DATTQPGYAGKPVIELSGRNIQGSANGLILVGGDSTVRGLIVNQFPGDGIELLGQGGDTVLDNYLGTDATGAQDRGNTGYGIRVLSSDNLIQNNVISGNDQGGVLLEG